MTSRTLDQLNERIGEAGALRLIRHFGGRRLYVPLRIADRHPIRLSLGNVIADKLEIEYGGLWIDPVPRDDVALRDDRDDEILRQIKAGDSVIFWHGFSCDWTVTARMTKHYAYYNEDGEPEGGDLPGISCDVCGADCFAESYLFAGETDLCPKCFKADKKYAGSEHQKEGEPVPTKAPPKKKQKKR